MPKIWRFDAKLFSETCCSSVTILDECDIANVRIEAFRPETCIGCAQ